MKRLMRDNHAVAGLPMTLLVTMIVLAITVPLVFGSLRTYDRGRLEAELSSELGHLIESVQMIYISGPGNSAVLEFNVPRGAITQVEYVVLGDQPGGDMTSIVRYRIRGRQEMAMAVTSPSVPMISGESAGLELSSGKHWIRAECGIWDGTRASVRLMPLT